VTFKDVLMNLLLLLAPCDGRGMDSFYHSASGPKRRNNQISNQISYSTINASRLATPARAMSVTYVVLER